jgi:chemotaxis family two-component system response regulator Rcp1
MRSIVVTQRTVLVVEDNEADADLVVDALDGSPEAPRLIIAKSGRDALVRLRDPEATVRPDLLLLDLNLPGFSGLATLAELKGDPVLRPIPVIVLTTSKSEDEINRCYELGAAAVLNKPLRLREYRQMLGAFERFWLGHVRYPAGL